MAVIAATQIGPFRVEVEPNEDRPGVNCWIYKGRASASLACAEDHGALSPGEACEVAISEAQLDRVRAFANAHGYDEA